MPKLRIMTFNVENMLASFDFEDDDQGLVSLLDAVSKADRDNLIRTYWNMINDENRVFTALSIKAGMPEVICLQEVESLDALNYFHDRYLHRFSGIDYPYKALIKGNDPRGINVAVMSQHPIDWMATHQAFMGEIRTAEEVRQERVFRRDCLEVRVLKEGKILPIFVCHFKSMDQSREETKPIREAESMAVRSIIEARFRDPSVQDWLVVGDLNDYTETDGMPEPGYGIWPLLDRNFSEDLVKRISNPYDRWTHYYPDLRSYHQLDYILASPSLSWKNRFAVPWIIRSGAPYMAERYTGPRWPRVGYERPKASDHCPVVVELEY